MPDYTSVHVPFYRYAKWARVSMKCAPYPELSSCIFDISLIHRYMEFSRPPKEICSRKWVPPLALNYKNEKINVVTTITTFFFILQYSLF